MPKCPHCDEELEDDFLENEDGEECPHCRERISREQIEDESNGTIGPGSAIVAGAVLFSILADQKEDSDSSADHDDDDVVESDHEDSDGEII